MVGDFLARLEVNWVSNAAGRRDGSDAECVDVVLGHKLRVVVHARLDGVAVDGRGLGNLLTSSERYRVARAVRGRNGVNSEGLLFLAAKRRRSDRESAGNVRLVFDGLNTGNILLIFERLCGFNLLVVFERLGASKGSGTVRSAMHKAVVLC